MVPDLQDVDRRNHPTAQQELLDRRLRIAGEHRAEGPVAQYRNHRSVVDVAIGQRQAGIGVGREEHLQRRRRVEGDDLAGAGRDQYAERPGIGQQAVVGRILVLAIRLDHDAHPEAGQDLHQPGDMVLVRVGDDHQFHSAAGERQRFAEPSQGQIRIRPAVDDGDGTRWRLDQEGVSLADVEHGQVQATVRSGGNRDRDQDGRGRADQPRRAGQTTSQP
jgi:hypothetical protein